MDVTITYSFSGHGASRSRERGITREQLDSALNHPTCVTPGEQQGRKKYVICPNCDGLRTVVVASDPPDATGHVTIITCYLSPPTAVSGNRGRTRRPMENHQHGQDSHDHR
ncbi:DUF4258 domain-containing protein [Actinomyces ruminis]|uniref:DUF4258 domain-containing protein n=1 Tax=Actinomyces ruminis TaxID=1937003 RepID=UPI000B74EACD|nr:DUF4258 domain-containing protein [Actinomyces ruminis]